MALHRLAFVIDIAAFQAGKWRQETCRHMIYDFRRRPFREEGIEIFTDGNDVYTYVLKTVFPGSKSILNSPSGPGTSMGSSYASRGAISMENPPKMT